MKALVLCTWLLALEASVGSVPVAEGLAEAEKLFAQGDYQASLAAAQRNAEPPSALAYFIMGSSELRLGHEIDAKNDLQRAIDLDPGFNRPGLHYQLGYLAMQEAVRTKSGSPSPRKLFRGALEHFEAELRLVPDEAAALSAMAMVLDRLDRRAEAITATRKWVEVDPTSIDAHSMLIVRLATSVALPEALRAIESFPEGQRARLLEVVLSACTRLSTKEAAPLLRRSLELQPGERPAFGLRAVTAGECALLDYLAMDPPMEESLVVARLRSPDDRLAPDETCKFTPPVLKHKVPPEYPELARAARISGKVVISAVIGANGRVKGLVVASPNRFFEQAALDAVRQWKFEPAMRDGKPVPIYFPVVVSFSLR